MTTLVNKEVWKELEPVNAAPNENENDDEYEDEKQTYRVERAQRWVNFTVEVEARSEDEAIKKSDALDFKDWTTTVGDEEVSSLESVFNYCSEWTRAESH
jgi:hypothetical protein